MSVLAKFDLGGKTALVTGAKRGIGRGMAEALAEAGADIIGVSATLDPAGSEVGDAVTDLGRKFTGYACDFSDRVAVKAFAAQVLTDHPQIDILLNNAGTILRKPAAEHPDEMWDEVIEVNLSAQFILTREIGATDGRARVGQDHLHRIASDLPGRHQCAGLCGVKGRHRTADDGVCE